MENYENTAPRRENLKSPEEIAKENFNKWNDALLTKDAKKVAMLYSADCTFLPTLSDEFKEGQHGAEKYFKHFLEKVPSGEIVQEKIQPLGENCYLHSGMYNFTVGPDQDRKTVEARFTFAWQKDEQSEWKIVHHHSSLKPKE